MMKLKLSQEARDRLAKRHGDLAFTAAGDDYSIGDARTYASNIVGLVDRLRAETFHEVETGIDIQSAKSWTLRLNAALDTLAEYRAASGARFDVFPKPRIVTARNPRKIRRDGDTR